MSDPWLDVYEQVRAVLPWWDAWCADDGRPAAALAAAKAYYDAPTDARRAALVAATNNVYRSYDMARAAYVAGDRTITTHRAYEAADAILCLCRAAYYTTKDGRSDHLEAARQISASVLRYV